MAMRFGGGISGWYWWALSVQVSTLPFPLTGSGKVQKFVLRQRFVSRELAPAAVHT